MRRISAVLVAWLALAASPARAEGPGVKLGDSLVLHPGLGLIVGHDSNIQYSSPDEPNIYGAYIALRPVIDLATLSAQRGGDVPHALDFRLHAGSSVRFLLTGDNRFNQHHISVDVDSSGQLTLFPFSDLPVEVFDNFVRSSVPPYFHATQDGNLNVDTNQAGIRFRYRPGGRRLEASLLYTFGLYAFEGDPVSRLFSDKNYLSHDFQLRVQWKFFPKTALYLNAQETIYSYYNRDDRTPPDSFPLRVVLGLVGLITPTLTVNLNVGYANGFYSARPAATMGMGCTQSPDICNASPQTASATVDLTWRPTLLTSLGIGYHHDFNVSLIGNYYDLDMVYLGIGQQIWRIVGTLRGAWERRAFQGDTTLDGQDLGRVDNLVTLHADLMLPIRDWIAVTIGDDVQLNFSNCHFHGEAPTPGAEPCSYRRNDAWLKLMVLY